MKLYAAFLLVMLGCAMIDVGINQPSTRPYAFIVGAAILAASLLVTYSWCTE